jgi:Ca2+-binding RTX toxin-like protein
MPTTHKTRAEAGAHITRDNYTWNGQGLLDTSYTITYGFRDTAPPYNDGTGKTDHNMQGTFSKFTATQIARTELALDLLEDVANITFNRVMGDKGSAYTDSATMLFANYTAANDGAAGFAYYPGTDKGFATPDTGNAARDGDFWFNTNSGTGVAEGSYNFQTLLHEIGHAIGLQHPGNYNAAPGTTITYAKDAEYVEDSLQYTGMSYFEASETKANHGGIYAYTPLVDDIMALQRLYGVRMTTRTGDTTYGFNSNADRDAFHIDVSTEKAVFAIWDAGGNDTLDFSGYKQDGTIDLGPGKFSSVGGLKYNIAVAEDPTNEPLVAAPNFFMIENAIGGKGNDFIDGNKIDNFLAGGDGNDILKGYEGKDLLLGGKGTNTILGGDDDDTALFNKSRLFYKNEEFAPFGPGAHKFTGSGLAAGEITTTDAAVEDHLFNVERLNGNLVYNITPGLTKAFVPLSKDAKSLHLNDDGSSGFIDLSSVFLDGMDFYGKHYDGVYVNNNGNLTFTNALSTFTPGLIGGGTTPIIAPFWADVDTRLGKGQTGFVHGKVSYDLDPDKGTFIVQWDNVGYYNATTDKYKHLINDFQLQLIDQGSGSTGRPAAPAAARMDWAVPSRAPACRPAAGRAEPITSWNTPGSRPTCSTWRASKATPSCLASGSFASPTASCKALVTTPTRRLTATTVRTSSTAARATTLLMARAAPTI